MTIGLIVAALLKTAPVILALAAACFVMRRRKAGTWLFVAAWATVVLLFGLNGIACGHVPLGSMYHVMVFLAACFFPLYLLLARDPGLRRLAPSFAIVSALPLVGANFMERDILWRRVPALQSPWFIPHVTTYLIAYAFAAIAFTCLISVWWAGIRRRDLAGHSTAADAVVRMMLPFMTFGLCSGAIWADAAWGTYWSWDPKETWSLITWALYMAFLHVPRTGRWRPAGHVLHALAFLALLITFLLVNIVPRLSSTLHSYG